MDDVIHFITNIDGRKLKFFFRVVFCVLLFIEVCRFILFTNSVNARSTWATIWIQISKRVEITSTLELSFFFSIWSWIESKSTQKRRMIKAFYMTEIKSEFRFWFKLFQSRTEEWLLNQIPFRKAVPKMIVKKSLYGSHSVLICPR